MENRSVSPLALPCSHQLSSLLNHSSSTLASEEMAQNKQQDALKAELKALLKRPENAKCADCGTRGTSLGEMMPFNAYKVFRSI